MSEPLHTKYRPTRFDGMVGLAPATVRALKRSVREKNFHAFLFHGPSGVGKTTLARIVAQKLGCDPRSITEIDAATHTGVDAMRAVQSTLLYKPMHKLEGAAEAARAIILDECHALSKQSWQSLLKSIEEPPKHAYWFFCTTELGKVPDTIKTRCAVFGLSHAKPNQIDGLVRDVMKKEGIKLSDEILDVVVFEAGGSPRQALVNLGMVVTAEDKKEAAEILRTAIESEPAVELCRMLLNGTTWRKVTTVVTLLAETDSESVRIQVCNYMAKVLLNNPPPKTITQCLAILDAFGSPYNRSENQAPLLLSIGRLLYGD